MSWETSERRAAVEQEDDRGADRVHVEDVPGGPGWRQAQRPLPLDGRALLPPGELILVGGRADLDEVRPVLAAGDHDQRPGHRPSSAPTAPLASRAADTGAWRWRR